MSGSAQHTKMTKRKFRPNDHPQRPDESPSDYDNRLNDAKITWEEDECLRPYKSAAFMIYPVAGISGTMQKT